MEKNINFQKKYAYILFFIYSLLTVSIFIGDSKLISKVVIFIIYIRLIIKIYGKNETFNYIHRYSEKIDSTTIYNRSVFIITSIIFILKSMIIIFISKI